MRAWGRQGSAPRHGPRDAAAERVSSHRGNVHNDNRLGGSQGTQVRGVLDTIEEYQVLSNQYRVEYGGGRRRPSSTWSHAAAPTRSSAGSTRTFRHFLPPERAGPDERTLQAGFAIGGRSALEPEHETTFLLSASVLGLTVVPCSRMRPIIVSLVLTLQSTSDLVPLCR
jgi:hypothetical protein